MKQDRQSINSSLSKSDSTYAKCVYKDHSRWNCSSCQPQRKRREFMYVCKGTESYWHSSQFHHKVRYSSIPIPSKKRENHRAVWETASNLFSVRVRNVGRVKFTCFVYRHVQWFPRELDTLAYGVRMLGLWSFCWRQHCCYAAIFTLDFPEECWDQISLESIGQTTDYVINMASYWSQQYTRRR